MKKLIQSILLGGIIPLLFFIVGQRGQLKDTENVYYGWAWAFIGIVWILATIATHTIILNNKESKNKKSG